MEGITYHSRLARGVSLHSRPTEGAPCQDPMEQWVLSTSLVARPDDVFKRKAGSTTGSG